MNPSLRDRLVKANIEPAQLAELVVAETNGTFRKELAAALRAKAGNAAAEQKLWDELFAQILSGIAAAWEWGHTEPRRAAEYAARLADAAVAVRKQRFNLYGESQ